MKTISVLAVLFALAVPSVFSAGVPQEINYQGMVEVNGVPYDGIGQFKFRITNQGGTETYWTNDGTTAIVPVSAVQLNVIKGLLSVRLGDSSHPNMTVLPPSVFENQDTWLEIWFDDGKHGYQRVGPKQKLASVPYAMMAETVVDGAITGHKIAREAVWPEHEGRSNTIVSYFASYNVDSGAVLVGTVPTSRTLVITDIVFGPSARGAWVAAVQVEYVKDAQTTVLYRGYLDYEVNSSGAFSVKPAVVSLRAGLPVPGGASLYVRGIEWTYQQSCTLSGFEFEN